MNVIDNISQNDSLSIVTEYGKISIGNQWYRYDKSTDCLIPLTESSSFEASPSLFDDETETDESLEPF